MDHFTNNIESNSKLQMSMQKCLHLKPLTWPHPEQNKGTLKNKLLEPFWGGLFHTPPKSVYKVHRKDLLKAQSNREDLKHFL